MTEDVNTRVETTIADHIAYTLGPSFIRTAAVLAEELMAKIEPIIDADHDQRYEET